jgi:hypothetical protein
MEHRTIQLIANTTIFELITGLRRDAGNHLRLLCVLTTVLLIPVVMVLLAMASTNAATNLETRRLVSAFVANAEMRTDSLKQSVLRIPGVEQINVLPAIGNIPPILEVTPAPSLTLTDIEEMVSKMQSTGAFSFVNADKNLLRQNISGSDKARSLALVLFLMALVTAALICLVVVKREIFRKNSAAINLKRQLGATLAAITRPYVLRAAALTALAVSLAAIVVTVFYKILHTYVDISSYSGILKDSIPVRNLLILAIVCIITACFAAATALQNFFTVIKQSLKSFFGVAFAN